jgi:hypothetical protein
MKRFALVLTLLLAAQTLHAGKVQENAKSRWLGAWVVTTIETYSDCGASFTNNRINGNLVKSRGAHAFERGELAKLLKLDAKRSRIDVSLSLAEPILLPYQAGPFTLYKELHCKVELEVEIPRESIKSKDHDSVEETLLIVLERYASQGEARTSDAFANRVIDDYPEDYETTLHEHSVWIAETNNEAVRDKFEQAMGETNRLSERLTSDPEYLEAFIHGVETARESDLRKCSTLLAIDLDRKKRNAKDTTPEQARTHRGYEDGKNLIYGLEMISRLPDCYVGVPADLEEQDGS